MIKCLILIMIYRSRRQDTEVEDVREVTGQHLSESENGREVEIAKAKKPQAIAKTAKGKGKEKEKEKETAQTGEMNQEGEAVEDKGARKPKRGKGPGKKPATKTDR
jgi:esterase/lipase superfamily enzyme